MRYRKNRRYGHRSNDRGRQMRGNGAEQGMLGTPMSFNGRGRNNVRTQQSAEKLAEKYNTLAREAKSSGDKILSENYSQHADHFMRVVDEKNLNQNKISIQVKDESNISEINSTENNKIHQDKDIKEKKE